ncbi:MAG: hypothetical protein ACTHJX_11280, partial [Terriglobales bacterium]
MNGVPRGRAVLGALLLVVVSAWGQPAAPAHPEAAAAAAARMTLDNAYPAPSGAVSGGRGFGGVI